MKRALLALSLLALLAVPAGAVSGGIGMHAGWIDMHDVDAICSGHFHHWGVNTYNDRPIFRNGSLSGGSTGSPRRVATSSGMNEASELPNVALWTLAARTC